MSGGNGRFVGEFKRVVGNGEVERYFRRSFQLIGQACRGGNRCGSDSHTTLTPPRAILMIESPRDIFRGRMRMTVVRMTFIFNIATFLMQGIATFMSTHSIHLDGGVVLMSTDQKRSCQHLPAQGEKRQEHQECDRFGCHNSEYTLAFGTLPQAQGCGNRVYT